MYYRLFYYPNNLVCLTRQALENMAATVEVYFSFQRLI